MVQFSEKAENAAMLCSKEPCQKVHTTTKFPGKKRIYIRKEEALRECKPTPKQLTLWAVFTLKGIILYFVYKNYIQR